MPGNRRHRYDGSKPQRTTHYTLELANEHIVTNLDLSERHVGTLVVTKPGTLAEQVLDNHVFGPVPVHSGALYPGTVAYTVFDGERSGVWIGRPASN